MHRQRNLTELGACCGESGLCTLSLQLLSASLLCTRENAGNVQLKLVTKFENLSFKEDERSLSLILTHVKETMRIMKDGGSVGSGQLIS